MSCLLVWSVEFRVLHVLLYPDTDKVEDPGDGAVRTVVACSARGAHQRGEAPLRPAVQGGIRVLHMHMAYR